MHSNAKALHRQARRWPTFSLALIFFLGLWNSTAQPLPQAQDTPAKDPAVERGRKQFAESCGFCHGPDATGARGPDLVRSPLVAHDVKGDLIGEVIRCGRPDKGMPPLATMTDEQVTDIAAFLHERARGGDRHRKKINEKKAPRPAPPAPRPEKDPPVPPANQKPFPRENPP